MCSIREKAEITLIQDLRKGSFEASAVMKCPLTPFSQQFCLQSLVFFLLTSRLIISEKQSLNIKEA